MKKKVLFLAIIFLGFIASSQAQILQIFHPKKDEKIAVYNFSNQLYDGKPLHFKQGEKFTVKLINPNPLFYKYELKYEEQKEEAEDKAITDALDLLNLAFTSRMVPGRGPGVKVVDQTFEAYKETVNQLMEDIKLAQSIINNSEVPEEKIDVLSGRRTGGLKYAMDQIQGKVNPNQPLLLSANKYRFHNPNLQKDLDDLVKPIAGDDEVLKQALLLLNKSLVQKIIAMKNSMNEAESEIISEFLVTDKTTKVYLTISIADEKNTDPVRLVNAKNERFEIATIIPDYKRSTLEIVPVGNFLFAKDVKEFYVDDAIVQSRYNNKTTFSPGVVLNINVLPFGNAKEISLGGGLGYRFSDNSKVLENLFASTLLSYKNFFRIGVGVGFAQFPNNLKDGIKVGELLPSDISNLEDVIEYEEKLTGFLTIAFTGLNLGKKK